MVGVGGYLPKNVMLNSDLSKFVDTSDEWIRKRTGIKQRHIISESELTSDLGYKAAEIAIKSSGIKKEEIDIERQRVMADAMAKQAKTELDMAKLEQKSMIDAAKLQQTAQLAAQRNNIQMQKLNATRRR